MLSLSPQMEDLLQWLCNWIASQTFILQVRIFTLKDEKSCDWLEVTKLVRPESWSPNDPSSSHLPQVSLEPKVHSQVKNPQGTCPIDL